MRRAPALLRCQRGVAMVTVLLVAAALTAVTAAAAFVTVEEFGADRADRNAAQALSYAEAGIDRMMLEIRKGNLTWNNLSFAGCYGNPKIALSGSLGNGTYSTELEVYDRQAAVPSARFIPTACNTASTSPLGTHSFLITSTGLQRARRVIRQVVDIKPLGIPVGIYAYDRVDANGTVNLQNISVVTEGTVTNRDNLGFKGTDPYYTLGAFYGTKVAPANANLKMPSAMHAKGAITWGAASKANEHPPEPNCDDNVNKKGTVDQQMWDSSGTAVQETISSGCVPSWPGSGYVDEQGNLEGSILTPNTVLAPTSKFTEDDRKRVAPQPTLTEQDYLTLREAAKANGVYCTPVGNNLSCLEGGVVTNSVTGYQLSNAEMDHPNIPNTFVVYIDFPGDGTDTYARSVKWIGNEVIGPCNTNPLNHRSVVWVIRNGSFDSAGGAKITGAMLIPEGQFQSSGNFILEGTIIARRFLSIGTMTIRLSDCWVRNLPGPFLDVTPVSWTQVDR